MAETTSFEDTNKTFVAGYPNMTGTLSGFWDNAVEGLFNAGDSTDGCKIYLYPSRDASTIYWYGPAWLDASVDVGTGGASKVAAKFNANGAWGRQWP